MLQFSNESSWNIKSLGWSSHSGVWTGKYILSLTYLAWVNQSHNCTILSIIQNKYWTILWHLNDAISVLFQKSSYSTAQNKFWIILLLFFFSIACFHKYWGYFNNKYPIFSDISVISYYFCKIWGCLSSKYPNFSDTSVIIAVSYDVVMQIHYVSYV